MTVGPGDAEPSQSPGGEVAASLVPAQQVTFDRRELNRLLGLYGRKVAAGEGHRPDQGSLHHETLAAAAVFDQDPQSRR